MVYRDAFSPRYIMIKLAHQITFKGQRNIANTTDYTEQFKEDSVSNQFASDCNYTLLSLYLEQFACFAAGEVSYLHSSSFYAAVSSRYFSTLIQTRKLQVEDNMLKNQLHEPLNKKIAS